MATDREIYNTVRNKIRAGKAGADLFAWLGFVYRKLPATPQTRKQAEFYLALAHQIDPSSEEFLADLVRLKANSGQAVPALALIEQWKRRQKITPLLAKMEARLRGTLTPGQIDAAVKKPAVYDFLDSSSFTDGAPLSLFFGNFDSGHLDFTSTFKQETGESFLSINPVKLIAQLNAPSPHSLLYYLARDLEPRILFYSIAGISKLHENVDYSIFAALKEHFDFSLVLVCYDLAKPNYERIVAPLFRISDAVVCLDMQIDLERYGISNEKSFHSFVPLDFQYFYDDGRERDIDVCFVGSRANHYRGRQDLVDLLGSAGISVLAAGGATDPISKTEYTDLLRRSKISLNLSWTLIFSFDLHPLLDKPQVTTHLKGRVIESMRCGALLFEDDRSVLPPVFKEGEHYVRYSTSNIVEKARYYLSHDDERRDIAERGRKTAEQHYSPSAFWKSVFEKLEMARAASSPLTIRRNFFEI
ncbi:glycosyltransferase family protein [Nisaea sp.]|uniref:glycosyltransferase family protein n=1 Tax=Nisaea sp. TaxID=2024842 RepID=UPI003B521BD6